MGLFCGLDPTMQLTIFATVTCVVFFAMGWGARCLYQQARELANKPIPPKEMGRALKSTKKERTFKCK